MMFLFRWGKQSQAKYLSDERLDLCMNTRPSGRSRVIIKTARQNCNVRRTKRVTRDVSEAITVVIILPLLKLV